MAWDCADAFSSITSEASPQTQDCKTQDEKFDLTATHSRFQGLRPPILRLIASLLSHAYATQNPPYRRGTAELHENRAVGAGDGRPGG